jgi:uncharacterized protein YndB with AHSA1/START domain
VSEATRVELQAEIDAPRTAVWPLLSTSDGLARWLDEASAEPTVGAAFRFRLHESEATGEVVAVDPPQHISFRWHWSGESAPATVLALDAIDHGARTHVTLRHVGFRDRRQLELHDQLWRHWFDRLCRAAGERTDAPEPAPT